MISILIVDDDVVARAQLRNIISLKNNSFQFYEDCSNGMEAMRAIENNAPDIVITDMSMPLVNGVELISYIRQNYPDIKVIALSAYDDYEYVRQSLKLGAIDYILKHKIGESNILGVLDSAVDAIKKDNKEKIEKQKISKEMILQKELVKKDLLKKLSNMEKLDDDYLEQFKRYFEIESNIYNSIIIVLEVDDYAKYKKSYTQDDEKMFINAYIEIIKEIIGDASKSIISHIEEGKFIVLVSFSSIKSESDMLFHINSITERIKLSTKRYFNRTVSLGVSDKCSNISELGICYAQAEEALKEKFFKGKDNIFKISSQKNNTGAYMDLGIEDEKNITVCLESCEEEKLKKCVEAIFHNIIKNNINMKTAKIICFQIVSIISKILKQAGIRNDLIKPSNDLFFDIMDNFETAEEQKQYIIDLSERAMELLKSLKIMEHYSEYTKKAIKYINENYKRDISLDGIAESIGITSPYLSRIFKNDYKGGLSRYINMVRVEHAKFLIKDGSFNLKQIVNETGFNNYNYFFKVFKDIEGITPVEYKDNLKG